MEEVAASYADYFSSISAGILVLRHSNAHGIPSSCCVRGQRHLCFSRAPSQPLLTKLSDGLKLSHA